MKLYREIAEHALAALPDEACGCIVGDQAIRCENTSNRPDVSFVLSAEDYMKYRPKEIFHSHPKGMKGFSDHDIAVAANMELVSYLYVVEADRLERWSAEEGLAVYEKILGSS
jgi:proteasome lid subunit RPN8/RPN11